MIGVRCLASYNDDRSDDSERLSETSNSTIMLCLSVFVHVGIFKLNAYVSFLSWILTLALRMVVDFGNLVEFFFNVYKLFFLCDFCTFEIFILKSIFITGVLL